MGTSDPRAAKARYLNSEAQDLERKAADLRRQRDTVIRKLRQEDSRKWTYDTLAKAVGVSRESIAVIIKGDPRKRTR